MENDFILKDNIATYGGAIYFNNLKDWEAHATRSIIVSGNEAEFGSSYAFYTDKNEGASVHIASLSIIGDTKSKYGAIYVYGDSDSRNNI